MNTYPASTPLQIITDPVSLPTGIAEIGQIVDTLNYNHRFVFYKNHGHLSIVKIVQRTMPNGRDVQRFYQTDFPMAFLTWFPRVLAAFRLAPGASRSSTMMSPEESVSGEMLAIARAVAAGGDGRPGYSVYNFSRACHKGIGLMQITWIESFLFEGRLLKLIKSMELE